MSAGGPQSNEQDEQEEEQKEEKIIFAVQLESYEPSVKVKIIKEIRKMTDLTLKDVRSFGCCPVVILVMRFAVVSELVVLCTSYRRI